MREFSVVHTVAGLHPSAGGPSRTVIGLCDALARHTDVEVALLSQGRLGEPFVSSAVAGLNLRMVQSKCEVAVRFGLPMRRELNRFVKQNPPALLHNHGVWAPVNHWASSIARRYNVPLIISPHGMLEPWSLAHKALKKRVAMAIYQQSDLDSAVLFYATAEMEHESIRALGFRHPVAVIPNGVNLVDAAQLHVEVCSRALKAERTALFLSRVHPKKGILNLLRAWAAVAPHGWCLEIAGPNEGGHLSEVMATADDLGIAAAVRYLGPVEGEAKSSAFARADLFVLPTFSENFGVVVAEALLHGLPVITTRGAPWADLVTHCCGWWVDIGVEPLVQALREAIALSDDERRAMGRRGRDYVQRYDWGGIAKKTIEIYHWVLGDVSKAPACVRLD